MDALRDPSWMRELYTSSPAERFERGTFSVVAVASRPDPSRRNERYRYRLFFFERGGPRPALAVNLEADILGTWRLTVTVAEGSRIAMSFDEAPGYEAFKAAALAVADEEIRSRSGAAARRARKPGVSSARKRPSPRGIP